MVVRNITKKHMLSHQLNFQQLKLAGGPAGSVPLGRERIPHKESKLKMLILLYCCTVALLASQAGIPLYVSPCEIMCARLQCYLKGGAQSIQSRTASSVCYSVAHDSVICGNPRAQYCGISCGFCLEEQYFLLLLSLPSLLGTYQSVVSVT